jgi:hypothetical protein
MRKRGAKATVEAPVTAEERAIVKAEAMAEMTKDAWTMRGFLVFNIVLLAAACILMVIVDLSDARDSLARFCMALGTTGMLIAMPLTYWKVGRMKFADWKIWQPFTGGIRSVCFQAIAWSFYGITVLLTITPSILSIIYPGVALKGAAIAAGGAAIIGNVSLISALFLYKGKQKETGGADLLNNDEGAAVPQAVRNAEKLYSQDGVKGPLGRLMIEAGESGWRSFVGLQVFLAAVGLMLAVMAELWAHDTWVRGFCGLLVFVCMCLAVASTHGIGGLWKHYCAKWSFFQPGLGGLPFVFLQVLSWTFFGLGNVIFLSHFACYLSPATLPEGGFCPASELPSVLNGALSAFAAELLMAGSLFLYCDEGGGGESSAAGAGAGKRRKGASGAAAKAAKAAKAATAGKAGKAGKADKKAGSGNAPPCAPVDDSSSTNSGGDETLDFKQPGSVWMSPWENEPYGDVSSRDERPAPLRLWVLFFVTFMYNVQVRQSLPSCTTCRRDSHEDSLAYSLTHSLTHSPIHTPTPWSHCRTPCCSRRSCPSSSPTASPPRHSSAGCSGTCCTRQPTSPTRPPPACAPTLRGGAGRCPDGCRCISTCAW